MTLLKGALYKAHKSNLNDELNTESLKKDSKNSSVTTYKTPELPNIPDHKNTKSSKEFSASTNIDFSYTKLQLETMNNAEKEKIYFAKDGGIYVGNEYGRAELKSDTSPIFISERQFINTINKKSNTLYVIQCIDRLMHVYYKLFCNGVTIFSSNGYTKQNIDNLLQNKQDKLESGKNIKTINNQSILGKGNIDIPTIKGIGVNSIEVIEESDYDELKDINPFTLYIVIPDSN